MVVVTSYFVACAGALDSHYVQLSNLSRESGKMNRSADGCSPLVDLGYQSESTFCKIQSPFSFKISSLSALALLLLFLASSLEAVPVREVESPGSLGWTRQDAPTCSFSSEGGGWARGTLDAREKAWVPAMEKDGPMECSLEQYRHFFMPLKSKDHLQQCGHHGGRPAAYRCCGRSRSPMCGEEPAAPVAGTGGR